MQAYVSGTRATRAETAFTWLLIAIMAILVIYPLGSLIYGSFGAAGSGTHAAAFSLAEFQRIFLDPQFYLAWRNSLIVSIGGGLIALVSGSVAAILIIRTDLPGKSVFEKLVLLPLFVAPFIGAIAWGGLAAPRVGLMNRAFAAFGIPVQVNIYSLTGVSVVLGFYLMSYVYLFISGPISSIDSSTEEASRLSGQGALGTLYRITLPLVTPSLLAAALLVTVLAMENFGVLAILGMPSQIPFVPTEIYLRMVFVPPDYGYATVVSLTLVAATALGLFAQRWLMRNKSYTAIGGRGYRPDRIRLRHWKVPIVIGFALFLFVTVVLPLGALTLASFQSYWAPQMAPFTLNNYLNMFARGALPRATENSLILSFVGAFLAVALAAAIAYVVQKTRAPGRGLLDLMGTISIAVPGVVLGVALLWAWIRVPLPIYGTLGILLIAYVTRFITFGVRNISAALTQVSGDLEAAARVSGASRAVAAMTVTLPLVRSSLIASWVVYFISFIKELNTSVLLYSFNSVVLPVIIFDANTGGGFTQVAALAVGVSVLIFAVLAAASLIFNIKIRPHA